MGTWVFELWKNDSNQRDLAGWTPATPFPEERPTPCNCTRSSSTDLLLRRHIPLTFRLKYLSLSIKPSQDCDKWFRAFGHVLRPCQCQGVTSPRTVLASAYLQNKRSYVFPLCHTCTHTQTLGFCNCNEEQRALTCTWCTPGLAKAWEKGYRILTIYEVYQFPEVSYPDRTSLQNTLTTFWC